jgi:hypothetical protein
VCGENRVFGTTRQREMFYKLHNKKCKECCNSPNLYMGTISTTFSNQALSHMEKLERLEIQNELKKIKIN